MVNWKGGLKKVAVTTGKSIAKGAKIVADETKKRAQIIAWKNQILDTMYPGTIKKLALNKGLRPQNIIDGGRPTIDDYRRAIIMNVSLDELIEYCQRKRIPIRHIVQKIDKARAEREINEMGETGNIDETLQSIVTAIHNFEPSQHYKFELPYQTELVGYLKAQFSNAVIEKQRGSSRPDIVIGGIAIEVKGPTRDRDLQTIADKCLRYSEYFKQGIIVVLFNVYVNTYRYKDWYQGMKRTYPQVQIIKK